MRPLADFRGLPWEEARPILFDIISELYRENIFLKSNAVINGQKTAVAFQNIRVLDAPRGHWFAVTVDGTNPDAPFLKVKDVGTKALGG